MLQHSGQSDFEGSGRPRILDGHSPFTEPGGSPLRHLQVFFLGVLTVLFVGDPALTAESVSGSFEHSARGKIEPAFVAAIPIRAAADPDRTAIQVVLTPTEIDAEAAALSLEPELNVVNQKSVRGTDYIVVNFWNDGDVAVNGKFHRGNAQFITTNELGDLKLEIRFQSEDHIAGHLWTDPIETQDGDTYHLDLTFDTAITRPPPSKPLPPGGGEPAAVFQKMASAVVATSWDRLKPLLSAEQVAQAENGGAETDRDRVGQAVGSLQTWLVGFGGPPATSFSVSGGSLREDGVADLDVKIVREGLTHICQARMVRSEERWLFEVLAMKTLE